MGRRGYSVPAVRFPMGAHLQCFQTTVRVGEIVQLLGHDPRSKSWSALAKSDPLTAEMYQTIQRKSPKDRVDALEEYIYSRLRSDRKPRVVGAFPAISVAFELAPTEFDKANGSEEMGYLVLPSGRRILLDGLQRVTAALDVYQDHREIDDWFVFAATFYFPVGKGRLTNRELGQLFFDMNYKQKTMSPVHAMKLDQADPYLQLTNDWNESGIIHEIGGVEDAASLGKKSTALVVRKHLFKFVRGAIEGRRAQDQDKYQPDKPRIDDDNYSDWSLELQQFLYDLRSRMGDERFADRSFVHLSSGGWQVLGLIFHDVYVRLREKLSPAEKEEILDRLAGIDWSRYNPKWISLFGDSEVDEQGKSRLGKSTRWGSKVKTELLQYVREQAGLTAHLATNSEADEEIAVGSEDEEPCLTETV
jgi:hypothetical protein